MDNFKKYITETDASTKTKERFDKALMDRIREIVKDNPKKETVATAAYTVTREFKTDMTARELAAIYKNLYEEAPATNTGSVPGAGDDSETVIVKKKKKVYKRAQFSKPE
jgi:hypothetical protein